MTAIRSTQQRLPNQTTQTPTKPPVSGMSGDFADSRFGHDPNGNSYPWEVPGWNQGSIMTGGGSMLGGWSGGGSSSANDTGAHQREPLYADEKGKINTTDPNVTWKDRLGRTAKGAVEGYDTGSTLGNIALGTGASVTGLGGANRVAGAVQGATSNKPVARHTSLGTDYMTPQSAPSATGSNVKSVPTANQTALQQALSGGANAPTFHQTEDDGSTWDAQNGWNGGDYSGGGGGGVTTAPAGGGGVQPSTLPAPAPDPDGIEAPKLGTPQGDAALNYLYNQYYGRNATPEEIASHRGNPGGLDAVAAALKKDEPNHVPLEDPTGAPAAGTPEAEQDALKQILSGGQHYQTDGAQGRVGVAGQGGGNYSYAGFDFGQDPANRDIGKSAKYAFSHLAGQAAIKGIPQPRSKEEAQAWFEQNIKPGMDALGYTVHKVQGDKAFISAPEHPEGAWVDFQGNSGGVGDQPLAWMAELGTSADTDPEAIFAVNDWGGGGASGMDRGEEGLGSSGSGGVGGVLDSGNKPLDSFAQRLIQQLLEGAALDDAVGREGRTTKGITPQGLASVGF